MKCLDCNKKMEEVWEDSFLVYECKNCIAKQKHERKNAFSEYVRRKNYMSGIKE